MMDNSDENNNIIYSKINENNNKKNSNEIENYNTKISKLFDFQKCEKFKTRKNKKEKTEIKTNDKISIKSASSDKSKINLNKKDKLPKFDLLNTSHSTSFTISSSYDNINKISKYNYNKNPKLRERTKNLF